MRTLKLMTLGLIAVACLQAASVHAIENVRGKQYQLTTKHGPWMVMVTSFSNVRDKNQKTDGLTAEQAATELVFELRELGIPAYTFSQDAKKGEIDTLDRLGRDDRRIYAAQRDMICVLAGNYDSIDDPTGKKTLQRIKNFRPKFLKDAKSGAILRAVSSEKGPLAGAFLTINPMIKPEDVVHRSVDKEIKALNSGIKFALVSNPHKYTVQVASFTGKSATPLGNSAFRGKEGQFDLRLREPSAFNVVRAGEDAGQLVDFLRMTKGNLKKSGELGQFADAGIDEAYVYHDKFQSIVTIGGFDDPKDPRIRMITQYYGVHLVPDFRLLNATHRDPIRHPPTQEEVDKLPKMMTTHTEQLFAAGADPKTAQPLQVWTFDPEPKVIPVPRIR